MDFSAPEYFLNRELSLLAFQDRVLQEGLDSRTPLLERVRMLYYFTKNTDEFFMKRIGMLKQEMEAGITRRSVDGRTPKEQWEAAMEIFRGQLERQYRAWSDDIQPALANEGIRIVSFNDIPRGEQKRLRAQFRESILPALTPLAFDPAHPFPFISNLSLSIGLYAKPKEHAGDPVFTRIKVPPGHPPFFVVPSRECEWTGVALSELICANLDLLMPDTQVQDISLFRVTRSAEVDLQDDVAEDLLGLIAEMLEERRRAPAVRLEVDGQMPLSMRQLILRQLGLTEAELIEHSQLVDFLGFETLANISNPELKYPEWPSQSHPVFSGHEDEAEFFDLLKRQDVLVHHPYHSFDKTTLRFLEKAADDPKVIGIKIAIYRTDDDSKVLNALVRAAHQGKQVAVLVELKARFDEHQNLRWVQLLEDMGIHVAYGQENYKTHTKLALVIREETDGVRLYSHIGTGNYNSSTAKGYTDLGLITASKTIGRDVINVFNIFTGPHKSAPFGELLIAPNSLKDSLLEHIENEARLAQAGKTGRIIAKMNALEDVEMVQALYEAARRGVEIDLIIRDICRLRPNLNGISESVRVHSIVGRFLEHSRAFYFGNGDQNDPSWLIGSADWMKRNLNKRIEAVVPVTEPVLQAELRVVIETLLADNRRRWRMQSDGSYIQCEPSEEAPVLDGQEILMDRARKGLFGVHGPREPDILKRQPGSRARITGDS